MEMPLYARGAEAKREIGIQTDIELLGLISGHEGFTIYELKRASGWSFGKVYGSVQRLREDGKIMTLAARKKGRLANLVYTFDSVKSNSGVINIDTRLLDRPDLWSEGSAYSYCLGRNILGISCQENAAWRDASIFSELSTVEITTKHLRIHLSEKLRGFYMLGNNAFEIGSSNNDILVTFSDSVIPIVGSPKEMSEIEDELQSEEKTMSGVASRFSHSQEPRIRVSHIRDMVGDVKVASKPQFMNSEISIGAPAMRNRSKRIVGSRR